jgi:3-deoxy-D-manno-octulosonic-acid transferase
LRASHPRALLVLAPRHPNRFDDVKAALSSKKIPFVSRSSRAAPEESTQVLLVDALGELIMFYAASDIAFVGGSLVPIGGHNLLEPAALGRPILTGPNNFNAPDIVRALLAEQAALEVHGCEQLTATLAALFDDHARREAIGARAAAFVTNNKGALQRVLTLLEPHLSGRGPLASSRSESVR